ncbi:S-layer homology domain-containing protein [Olsenella sp. An293]|uniref:S-layer homology domain-containing protein n=1 Tax=Olsenella sp. An293 TaxID=1965626 RepID=UPI000B36F9BA|nr:S-layer homology domain-containing protein [Olsenella sp. An293]OUO32638.1 hypothetical protein B5F85_05015 [Olsenella sp. An293]
MRKRLLLMLGAALLCLGIMPASAYAAGSEGYEVSTDWVTGTTTYRFTDLEKVEHFSVKPEGDAILDFTRCMEPPSGTSKHLIISPEDGKAHITVRGTSGVSYGFLHLSVSSNIAGLMLQDFRTESSLFLDYDEDTCEIVYDGDCAVNQLQFDDAAYTVRAADDASRLDLGFASQDEKGSVTFSGNLSVESSLRAATMTIRDAFVSFGKTYLGSAIVSPQLTIESSTINGVGHINSFEYPSYETVTFDAFHGSFITIDDSQISFDADVGGNGSATVLGNSETITIKGSVVSGIEVTSGYGCLGGIFERVTIEGSEVYAKSDHDAAIGPNDSAYGQSGFSKFGITSPSITIEDSVVEAASTYGAAIGMPRLSESLLENYRPALSIIISGKSDVTATSVRSAAIGASSSKSAGGDVDGVEIEVGAGDITWGRSSDVGLLGTLLNVLGLDSGSAPERDLADAAGLLSGCTVTIKGSPTISAKSGVMAVYADTVSVEGTNLVQDTMVIADGSDKYSVYPMETPGAVTIGSETIGELGYGYASVARTGVSEQSSAAMAFGDSPLTDALIGGTRFTVSQAGVHSFFTTPRLTLSGAVSITGASNGTASVSTVLNLNLNELAPASAVTNPADSLTFAWQRDGEEVSGATSRTYLLTDADNGKVITCVVSGERFFEGSVTSDAVLVSSSNPVAAPTLGSRTKNSITLNEKGVDYEYRLVGTDEWQDGTTFGNLAPGTTYVFQQKDPSDNVSAPASFSTLSEAPNSNDFRIDYVNETLSFPSGVHLYSDSNCTDCLNKNSSKTSISISEFIDPSGATLYARFATADPTDTESVTTITIPARPEAPTLTDEAITVTSDSVSFVGTEGVSYRLLAGGRVLKTETGDGQATITFGSLSPATKYSIEMRVEASNETSTFRSGVAEQSVTTDSAEPIAPTLYVQAKPEGAGYESVRVGFSWERPVTNGADITGYVIYAQADEGSSVEVWSSESADVTSCEVVTGESGVALLPGETYTFTLQVNWSAGEETSKVTSEGAQAMLPSLSPNPDGFTIDYFNETLTVPEGVNLYKDESCTDRIVVANNKLSITEFISDYGKEPQSLYACYASAGNDADAVTEIPIPARTYVATVRESDMTLTHNSLSLRKEHLKLDTYDYELRLGSDPIDLASDNGSYLKYEGLTPETAYSLVITKRATAELFKSSIVQTITTKRAIAKRDTLLVPASESSYARAISYDISSLLDGAKITDVSEENDDAGILTSRNWNNTVVRLGFLSASVGQSATVEVEAQLPDDGDYLVLTLTLKVVDVMAEGTDGTYWVHDELSEDEVTSVDAALENLPDGSQRLDAFDLSPLNSVGGTAATNAASAKATWEFSKDIETTGTFDVYRIENGAATKLDGVTKTDTGITFDVQGASACYAVVYTSPKPETFQVTAAPAQNGSVETDVQTASANDTVTVTVTPSQGFKLDALNVILATGDPITPALQTDGTYTFTMPAAHVTVSAKFVPITPVFSTFSATYNGDKSTVDVTWTLENNGAAITKYSLAVTLDGKPINGSPFSPNTNETSYKLTGLKPGTYSLVLTATNNGMTATSEAVTVTVPEPEPLTYTVTVEPAENGSFSASHSTAEAETTVTITPDPNEGYETASVMVKGANGEVVTATPNEDGTYAFEMPASNVTVSGTFEKVADDDEPAEDDLNALLKKTFEENDDFEAVMLTKGTYRLTDDLSIADLKKENGRTNLKTTSLYIGNDADGATVELDLQGHTLDAEDCALIVTEGSTLNLTDSVGGGSISGRKGLSYTDTTTGTKYAYAGGIAVYGTLNMSGGSITGNQAAGEGVLGYGGGVYVFGGGTFNMYDGTISGNTASTRGGGVAVRSATDATPVPNPLYVGGAEITDWNEVDGGDVDADLSVGLLGSRVGEAAGSSAGTFNLYGGAITGNSAPVAGGVYAGGVVKIGEDSNLPAAISVTGNTSGNLYVPSGATVTLLAKPAEGSRIGVTMEKAPGLFAKADENAASDVAGTSRASFTSDSGAYYVTTQQDGLALAYVPSAPTYEPEIVVPGGGGTVTTDPRYPEQGDEVTITPEPDEGKVVDTVEVTDKDGEPVEVTDNGDGTWTYRQPAGSVTITVTFACDGGALCPSEPYPDVDQSQWYHAAVDWAISGGVMTGYGDGTFGPDRFVTRSEAAAVLWNAAGKPALEVDESALPADVPADEWYTGPVAWSLAEGIFNGNGDGSFAPAGELTREQAACVLYNRAAAAGEDVSARADLSRFGDAASVSGWAADAMSWAVAEGVFNGNGQGLLEPGRAIARSELCAVLMNWETRE